VLASSPCCVGIGFSIGTFGEYQKAKNCFEKALEIDPNNLVATINFPNIYIYQLIDLDKIISLSFKSLKLNNKTSKFINQTVPLFRLKHDVQQAQYLIEKDPHRIKATELGFQGRNVVVYSLWS
jgi:tetratricopeptide (TPR) repeat protein